MGYKQYCKEPEKIENYEKAKKDGFVGWHCHHRLETHTSDGIRRDVDISHKELKALGMYYHRPASELIFMKQSDHNVLHAKGKPAWNRGKHHTEETRRKIAEAKKNMSEETRRKMAEAQKGKHLTEEARRKIAEAHKGKHHTEETRRKMAEAKKGKHWYTNGKMDKFCYECPEGFVPGMLR